MKTNTKKIIIIILLSIIICLLLLIILDDHKKVAKKIDTNILINNQNDINNKIDQLEDNDQNIDDLTSTENEIQAEKEDNIVDEDTQSDDNNINIQSNDSSSNTTSSNQIQNNDSNSDNSINDDSDTTTDNQLVIPIPTPIQEYKQTMAKEVLTLVNQARSENGLQPLSWNDSLESSAMIRSKELVTLFDHTRPDNTSCFTAVNVDFYYAIGENIAAGQPFAQAVFNAWMNSDGHRANILNADFTDIGISLYYDSTSPYTYNWVQLFIGK